MEYVTNKISQKYSRFSYLYNIVSVNNLETIMAHGILSRNEINRIGLDYLDISDKSVQNRRTKVTVPGGSELHAYANLYFNPRNAMLFRRREQINNLCILRISKCVLDINTTVVSDRNAATAGVMFWSPEEALEVLDFDVIYSERWDYPDYKKYQRYKQGMMAEILVLERIERKYIEEILVPNELVLEKVLKMNFGIPIKIDRYKFFQIEGGNNG